MNSSYYTYGIVGGIVFGVIVSLLLLRAFTNNHSLRTEYDEMQKRVRGDAYMYGFYAIVAYEVLLGVMELFVHVPAEPLVLHVMAVLIGIGVQAVYSIWNDAYVGLNTNRKTFLISMFLIGGLNLMIAAMAWADGRMIKNGILQFPFCNFMVFVIFIALGITGLIKSAQRSGEEE